MCVCVSFCPGSWLLMFQVNKIEVQYDKTSKQVDVHALKETLWGQIQESTEVPEPVSLFFSLVVDSFLTQVCVCVCIIIHCSKFSIGLAFLVHYTEKLSSKSWSIQKFDIFKLSTTRKDLIIIGTLSLFTEIQKIQNFWIYLQFICNLMCKEMPLLMWIQFM